MSLLLSLSIRPSSNQLLDDGHDISTLSYKVSFLTTGKYKVVRNSRLDGSSVETRSTRILCADRYF